MQRILLAFSILLLFACQQETSKQHVLPFIGNYDLEYKEVNGKEVVDTLYPKMIDFTFTNQDSVKVTAKSMKGKIWIADFFFVNCPTICPTMTKELKRVNEATKDISQHLQFMSFSINPKRDTPSQLRKYRTKYKIKAKNWVFLTGDEAFTNELGINNFQIFSGQDENSAGGYAHSGAFTLVDKEGYVRGVYLGTDPKDVNRLIKDIRKLLKYEYNIN